MENRTKQEYMLIKERTRRELPLVGTSLSFFIVVSLFLPLVDSNSSFLASKHVAKNPRRAVYSTSTVLSSTWAPFLRNTFAKSLV